MTFNCSHLFALRPSYGHVTLIEVREVYSMARVMHNNVHREAFYAAHGLDMQRVEEMLPTLEKLQGSLDASQRSVRVFETKIGPFKISIDSCNGHKDI